MKLRLLKLRLLVLALMAILLVPAGSLATAAPQATAATALTAPTKIDAATLAHLNPLANIHVTAAAPAGGMFSGNMTVQRFTAQHGHLVAQMATTGLLTEDARTRSISTLLAATTTVTGTCQVLTLVLGPTHLDLLGLMVDLNGTPSSAAMSSTTTAPITLTITGERGSGKLLGNLVCGLAGLLNGPSHASANTLAQRLNALNAVIQQSLSRLTRSFAVQGGHLVENVTYNGAVVGTAAVTPTSPMTCSVLTLDLAPLHLDLLGLVVDLSAVHLSITAVSGPGNLLGNLVCDLAHLLGGSAPRMNAPVPKLNAAVPKLNELFAVLRLQHLFEGQRL